MAGYIPQGAEAQDKAKPFLRRFEELKELRIGWEATWQDIAEYIMPRRTFNVQRFPGELRDRRLLDATAMVNNDRLAAMLFGFLISSAMPFVQPDVTPALQRLGRKLDDQGSDYLDGVQQLMHRHFLRAKSGFTVALGESLTEYCAFGNGITWTARKPGFGARYQSRPIQNSYIAVNAEDEVDTCFYKFSLPVWRVLERWPAAASIDELKKASERSENSPVELLLCVEPRAGGRPGAIAHAKPWTSTLVLIKHKVVLEESGYDSFPYAVMRFYVKPGEAYGYGPGHAAVADARMLNAMMDSVLRGAEDRVSPPLMAPLRMFPKRLDRRAGAVNYYQASQLGLQTADQAVRPLNISGDIALGIEMIREIRSGIDFTYFTDWMRLRENAQMTATEVNDRRDMRVRGMSPIVGRAERDGLGPIADRTYEINAAESMFGEAPQSLAGLDLDWGYSGPLALAQLQAQVQGIGLSAALAEQIAHFDPTAAKVFDAEEAQRVYGKANGLAPGVIRTHDAMAKIREADDAQREAMANAETTAQGAAALRDGAQGIASLTAANQAPAMDQAA